MLKDLDGDGDVDADDLKKCTDSSPTAGDYVAFEGHVKGAKAYSWPGLFKAVDANGDGTTDYRIFLPANETADFLKNQIGLDGTMVAYVYCRTGIIASGMFVAHDAVLGWPTVMYSGSWSQWGQMAGKENGGTIDNNSPWRTDVNGRTESITFNIDHGAKIEDPADGGPVNSFDTTTNRMEEEDKAYYESGAGDGNGGGGKPKVGC